MVFVISEAVSTSGKLSGKNAKTK